MMNTEKVWEILKRDTTGMYAEDGLKKKMFSGKPMKIKLGCDPSRPDLHLGHSVVLRKLKLLQDLGHEIIFLIGDFTGMVGDPSGKSVTRPPLTFEETRQNGESYLQQVTKILDKEKTRICYNSEWLAAMNFADVLRLCGKYTVARILERDDFSTRFKENRPIGMHELLYPLMQGYDSVALACDVEVGGTDQTFNLLVGRELMRDYDLPPQEVMTFPLLPGLDGVEKMSKSLDNYIGINEPAEVMFEKCMKVPDRLLSDYFRLTTDLDMDMVGPMLERDVREAHFFYGETIVTMYWSADHAADAKARYLTVASGATPEGIPEYRLAAGTYPLWKLVSHAKLANTTSEARRLISQGGVAFDGEAHRDPVMEVAGEGEMLLKRGKSSFAKLVFE
ncbi:MAG: tyrosine--tRNA ligase [Syntrophorhabdaceae bacterium]|nr:tyrosine--tRNA ligase [Syntrophorhabdaceae bacterium]